MLQYVDRGHRWGGRWGSRIVSVSPGVDEGIATCLTVVDWIALRSKHVLRRSVAFQRSKISALYRQRSRR